MVKTAWGIKARNPHQQDAIDALLDPAIHLVVMEGCAGAGKTLLAIAAGLEQTLEKNIYSQIIFTRAPVGLGSDMGFLPGSEEEKLSAWCGSLYDNLEVLMNKKYTNKLMYDSKMLLIQRVLKIKAMQFMRGRSFYNTWLIIDEVQNLTSSEIKVLVSRAGEDTKVVLMGDVGQIDHPKLSLENNGLASVLSKIGTVDFIKAIYLPDGERSQLATWAGGNL